MNLAPASQPVKGLYRAGMARSPDPENGPADEFAGRDAGMEPRGLLFGLLLSVPLWGALISMYLALR